MEQPVLTDQNEFPSDEVVFRYIGKSRNHWISLFSHISETYPAFTAQWRYYNDGKSWLMKVTNKSKTIFWLSVIEGLFRVTFYFTDKAEEVILNSNISEELKEQFIKGKKFNKIRGITVKVKTKKDIEDVKSLISVKLLIK